MSSVVGFPEQSKIYINENQSTNMKNLAYNARNLVRDGVAAETWFFNAFVRLKGLDGKITKISHETDLYD